MVFAEFITWYYYRAVIDILGIWRNFLQFSFDFFGIWYHTRTLFRPWRLVVVHFEDVSIIRKFFWNLASRSLGSMIGALIRILTIIAGIATSLIIVVAGLGALMLWLSLPLILGYALAKGFALFL